MHNWYFQNKIVHMCWNSAALEERYLLLCSNEGLTPNLCRSTSDIHFGYFSSPQSFRLLYSPMSSGLSKTMFLEHGHSLSHSGNCSNNPKRGLSCLWNLKSTSTIFSTWGRCIDAWITLKVTAVWHILGFINSIDKSLAFISYLYGGCILTKVFDMLATF